MPEEEKKRYVREHPAVLAPNEPYPLRDGETVGGSREPKAAQEIPVVPEAPAIVMTKENTHIVDAEELKYHPTSRDVDVEAFIQSACSIADHGEHKKPYVQINFGNGTAVFSYEERGHRYKATQVTGKGIVNDFETGD